MSNDITNCETSSEPSESAEENHERFRSHIQLLWTEKSALVPSCSELESGTFISIDNRSDHGDSVSGYSDLAVSRHDSYNSGPMSPPEQHLGTSRIGQMEADHECQALYATSGEQCIGVDDPGPEALPWGLQYSFQSIEGSSFLDNDQTHLKTRVESCIAVQHSEIVEEIQTSIPVDGTQSAHNSRLSSGYETVRTLTQSAAGPGHDLPRLPEEDAQKLETQRKENDSAPQQQNGGFPGHVSMQPLAEGGLSNGCQLSLALQTAYSSPSAEEANELTTECNEDLKENDQSLDQSASL